MSLFQNQRTGVLIQIKRERISGQNPNALASTEENPIYDNNEILFEGLCFVEPVPATRTLSDVPTPASLGQGFMWRVYIPKSETKMYETLLGGLQKLEVRFNLSGLYKNKPYLAGQKDERVLSVDRWEIGGLNIGAIELNCINL